MAPPASGSGFFVWTDRVTRLYTRWRVCEWNFLSCSPTGVELHRLSSWDFIRTKFSKQLMQFAGIEKIDEIQCPERDRQGWVVLNPLPKSTAFPLCAARYVVMSLRNPNGCQSADSAIPASHTLA